MARLLAYITGLARRRRANTEVDEELLFHVQQEIDQHIARGVPAAEAKRMALRDLGGLTQTREAVADVRSIWIDDVRQDVAYAVRTLRRSPGFSIVAVLTLCLGIGANTVIFSIVNAVLLRPLPYANPGSLVLIEPTASLLSPDWANSAWRQRAVTLIDFAGFNGPRAATLHVAGSPEGVDVVDVSPNFFSFLGVPPALGRLFTEQDGSSGSVAILSHDFWSRRCRADPEIVGTTISLGGASLTVVGVTAPTFRFPTGGALPASALPIHTQPDVIRVARTSLPLNLIARLAPGATPTGASTELLGIYKQVAADRFSQRFLDRAQVNVVPLQEQLVGDVRQRIWLAMGAVGFVLLIACANVTNLLLARASTRQRELAVRSALGASVGRLARQLITESLLFALIGSIGALLLTYWLRSLALTFLADSIPHVGRIAIDWWVLSFNLAIAAITGVICGLVSLPGVTRITVASAFNTGNGPAVSGPTRLRRLLLSTEIAFTFVLVVGAALLSQTLWNLNHRDRGFNADGLLTIRVSPSLPAGVDRIRTGAAQTYWAEFFSDLTQRIGRLPGVGSVATVSSVPLAGVPMGLSSFSIDGQAAPTIEDGSLATGIASITPGYFRTIGTPMKSGRDFAGEDRANSGLVAIVNEAFQRRYAPQQNIVGAQLTYDKHVLTVVGLVADLPDRSLRNDARPLLFTPLAQMAGGPFGWGQLTLVVRTDTRDPRSMATAIQRAIWAVDGKIVIDEVSSMNERVAASVRSEHQSAWLFGLFAGVALMIAAIGVYGVAAYTTAQRTREIGIRVALGARRGELARLVVFQTLGATLTGIGLGVAVAWLATRLVLPGFTA